MKNILLAISGLTPQIVTETFFALSIQKGITIDEIFIITTTRGKLVIEGKDKSKTTPGKPLKLEIASLCKEYEIKQPKFTVKKNVIVAEEESLELYDIKSDKDNLLFPNKTAEFLKKLTANNDTAIYASLSGGRKSMAAHLALALSLFARSQDKLYHVLTDEEFEFNNFYPKSKREERALVIAEIPFVKLCSLNAPILKSGLSYSQIVAKTQEQLKFLTENIKLIINLKNLSVRYKENSVNLSPIEISLYSIFVQTKINLGTGINKSELQSIDFAKKLLDFTTDNFNYYVDNRNKNHWSKKGITDEYYLSAKSKINKKIRSLFQNSDFAHEFIISTDKRYGDSGYLIKAPKKKLGINYE